MSPDDLDSFTVDLSDFLEEKFGVSTESDPDYDALHDFVLGQLEKFCTRDRNYN